MCQHYFVHKTFTVTEFRVSSEFYEVYTSTSRIIFEELLTRHFVRKHGNVLIYIVENAEFF